MDKGHWTSEFEFNIDEWFGFVYCITELDTGRKYLGKKQFRALTRKKIKGRKNRKHVYKESNWKKYTGSSKELNDNIKTKGLANYHFEIESLHETKGSLYYKEVERQVECDCLRGNYFNKNIAGVKYIPPPVTKNELRHRK